MTEHSTSAGNKSTSGSLVLSSPKAHVRSKSIGTDDDLEKLSSDLALFLSNPTLRQALADGSLDLASYSSTIDSELQSLEKDCIQIYRDNAQTIASLRNEMDQCDSVLASLQEMLLGFQADLGGLSGEIRALQEQSQTLGVQLKNRRDAEMGLRLFLERIIIPPKLAHIICSEEVDTTFMKCVQELETKYNYVFIDQDQKSQNQDLLQSTTGGIPPAQTTAGKEMQQHITKLRLRAVSRIRTYFLQKMELLRKPKTNLRMIQINSLLKYEPLVDFLQNASPDVYVEIYNEYIESMSSTLQALFRVYSAQLALLDNQIASRNDVIAVEDSSLRDMFSSKVNMSKRGDAFCLGDRGRILEYDSSSTSLSNASMTISSPGLTHHHPSSASHSNNNNSLFLTLPILAHVALAERQSYSYEVIFKSIMMHLMDAATNEYIFIRQFFKENGPDAFHPIFHKTFSLLLEQLENYLFNCYDCLGLLLMIKITHANKRIMKQRKVNSLDSFFDKVTNLLWPRLKTIMDKQIRSVRDGDSKKLGVVDLHAHYVSRRYAEFTCSILQILNKGKKGNVAVTNIYNDGSGKKLPATVDTSSSTFLSPMRSNSDNLMSPSLPASSAKKGAQPSHRGSAGDMLLQDLSILLDETVLLLERLADGHAANKKKIIFLINNVDQIISIFQERRVAGKELNRFMEFLMKQRELFVEEELLQSFSKMIAFVHQTEQHMHRTQLGRSAGLNNRAAVEDNKVDVNEQVVESLVREFAATWKQGIEQINKNVLSFFANFRNGMEILKQVLTQLLLYYTRFQDIIRKVWRSRPPAFCKDLVSTSTILAEIKKYALAI